MNGMEERGTAVTSGTSVSSAPASSYTERQSCRGTETLGHTALASSPASSLSPTEATSGFQNQSGELPIPECTIIAVSSGLHLLAYFICIVISWVGLISSIIMIIPVL